MSKHDLKARQLQVEEIINPSEELIRVRDLLRYEQAQEYSSARDIPDIEKVQELIGEKSATIEPWVETIIFTYSGTNNVQTLTYTPVNVWGETTLNREPLDPLSEFHYEGASIVISPDILTSGIEYKLTTQYFKISDGAITEEYTSPAQANAIAQNVLNVARPSIIQETTSRLIAKPPGPQGAIVYLKGILSLDGTKLLDNYDANTGELFNASIVSTYLDGTPMDDSKADGAIYFKNDPLIAPGYSKRDFTNSINVKWFKAKGDGVVDDSSAFINALLYLKKLRAQFYLYNPVESLELFIPGGKYLILQTVQIPKGISLRGQSANGSVLYTPSRTLPLLEIPAEAEATPNGLHGAFTAIESISIYGYHYNRNVYEAKLPPNGANHGVNVLRSRTRIRNCNIAGFEGAGVCFSAIYYISIVDTIIYANTRGIRLNGVSTSLSCVNVELRANSIGLWADSSYSCYLTNCILESNDANFLPQSDDGATLSLMNVKGVAIALQNCNNFVLSSCYIENHGVTSAYYGSGNNIIQNCIIVPGAAYNGTGLPVYKLAFQVNTCEGNIWKNNFYDTNGPSPYTFSGASKLTVIEVNTRKQFDDLRALQTANTVLFAPDRKTLYNKIVYRTDQVKNYATDALAAADTPLLIFDFYFDTTLRRWKYWDGLTWTIYGQEKPLSGTTAQRPQSLQFLYTNAIFFDTTINRPVFWSGTEWVDVVSVVIDAATTPYTKATINIAYPNAKTGFKVIADAAGFTYVKKDNNSSGNWSAHPSTQLA